MRGLETERGLEREGDGGNNGRERRGAETGDGRTRVDGEHRTIRNAPFKAVLNCRCRLERHYP